MSLYKECYKIEAERLARTIKEESERTGQGVYHVADYYLETGYYKDQLWFYRMVMEALDE